MTLIPFLPSQSATPPFQTSVTLDGTSYALTVVWNVYGQRWYFQITDQAGNVKVYAPLVGSSLTNAVNLLFGFFSVSTLVYRSATGNFEVTP